MEVDLPPPQPRFKRKYRLSRGMERSLPSLACFIDGDPQVTRILRDIVDSLKGIDARLSALEEPLLKKPPPVGLTSDHDNGGMGSASGRRKRSRGIKNGDEESPSP